MCLLIFGHRCNSHFPLVVAANRDEFHARPTAPAHFWENHPQVLAGRDLEQGGTWMGVTRQGRLAAVTNYRDPARTAPAPRSRGELPLDYLTGDDTPLQYLNTVAELADEYAGFNLLLGDRQDLYYFTNSLPREQRSPQKLAAGIYGLSNARLDTPWPKISHGKPQLEQLLAGDHLDHDFLAHVVGNRQLAEPDELHVQGLGHDMDHLLSAQFIVTPIYGTRSTTTLWLNDKGKASWQELSFNPGGMETRRVNETFYIG